MYGLVVIEVISLSGHLSNIDEIVKQWGESNTTPLCFFGPIVQTFAMLEHLTML